MRFFSTVMPNFSCYTVSRYIHFPFKEESMDELGERRLTSSLLLSKASSCLADVVTDSALSGGGRHANLIIESCSWGDSFALSGWPGTRAHNSART